MTSVTLLGAAAAAALAGSAFAAVAWRLGRRATSPENRVAGMALVLSWAALATQLFTDAGRLAIGGLPGNDVALYATLARLKIIAAGAMIWGFGFYVSYLWTGRRNLNLPILAFALSHVLLFLFLFERRTPNGIATGTWGTRLLFLEPAGTAPLPIIGNQFLISFAYYFLPPIVIAMAYLLLVPRFREGRLRWRATAAALAVVVYHASGLVQFNPKVDVDHWAGAAMPALVLAAALVAWGAYRQTRRTPLPPPGAAPRASDHTP